MMLRRQDSHPICPEMLWPLFNAIAPMDAPPLAEKSSRRRQSCLQLAGVSDPGQPPSGVRVQVTALPAPCRQAVEIQRAG